MEKKKRSNLNYSTTSERHVHYFTKIITTIKIVISNIILISIQKKNMHIHKRQTVKKEKMMHNANK